FQENKALNNAFTQTKENNSDLHLFGLQSDGGVHSHINHLVALLETAKDKGVKNVYIHAFLDGRDGAPQSSLEYLETLEKAIS
ncbi:2,3-bisphosphoglycerate-independent phosphoglycerate mutase, partial [Listeria monocytogenes]|nr:2,3-bisphosphoglycerate-independent phosphoglycerate mutase [Listeria monocytogenes]